MEIQQLKGFIAVALTGSFSKAAKKTFRTQPAVSLQIQALEQELKVQLIDRSGKRKIELTEEGTLLLDLLSPLIENFDTLKARFDELRGNELTGSVKIATHTSVMVYLIPTVVKTFKKCSPQCDLSIVNRGRNEIFSMLDTGETDIGITSLAKPPASLDFTPFAKFKRILITPRLHPLSKKKTVSPEEITSYPLILAPKGGNTRTVAETLFRNLGLDYNISVEITGREALKTYVEAGLGISIIEEFYLSKEDKQKFHSIDVSEHFGSSEYGVLTRKNRYLSKHVKEFIKMVTG